MGFLKSFVEGGAWWVIARSDLSGDGEYGIEGPRGAFSQASVSVVGRIEQRNEEMASGKEASKNMNRSVE